MLDDLTFVKQTRAQLLERGWWQGGFGSDGECGPVCIEGAANCVGSGGGDPYSARGMFRLRNLAREHGMLDPESDLPYINDQVWTDISEPLAFLDLLVAEIEKETAHAHLAIIG